MNPCNACGATSACGAGCPIWGLNGSGWQTVSNADELEALRAERDALLKAATKIARILSRVTPADDEREAFAQFFAVARGTEEETAERKVLVEWLAERGQR